MRERAAQAVLLARSFEAADPDGVLLSNEDRQAATDEGRAAGGTLDLQSETRAEALLATLAGRVRSLARVRAWTRVSGVLLVPVLVVALCAGLFTNALGPSRHVNLLAFPLLALLAWNLTLYALLPLGSLVRIGRRGSDSAPNGGNGAGSTSEMGFLGAVAWWIGEFTLERVRTPDPREAEVVTRGLAAYWSVWSVASLATSVARLRGLLHVGAAMLATGVVLGMYVRGLGLEFRATWESTFLSADTVASILGFVLGPASAWLGYPLPDAVGLQAMAAPDGSAPAAPWIHMWTFTTTGVVVLPRLVLATVQFARAAALSRSVPVDPVAGSFRALLVAERGADVRVDVHPYSYKPGSRSLETLRELLHDLFGLEARIDVRDTVAYGTELARPEDRPTCVVVVYGLVQSPEREVHGRYLEEWMEGKGDPQVLAVVDAASWHERFDGDAEQRKSERSRAWDRVLREVDLTALHVDLSRPLPSDCVERAEAALWPDESAARGNGRRSS